MRRNWMTKKMKTDTTPNLRNSLRQAPTLFIRPCVSLTGFIFSSVNFVINIHSKLFKQAVGQLKRLHNYAKKSKLLHMKRKLRITNSPLLNFSLKYLDTATHQKTNVRITIHKIQTLQRTRHLLWWLIDHFKLNPCWLFQVPLRYLYTL
jgi:hypothetical protein